MSRKCDVKGCEADHYGGGLCKKHHQRRRRGGDPHTPSRQELTLEERFRAKLGPKNPITGCVEWTAVRTEQGYGQIGRDGEVVHAHRVAYELKHGPIPKGLHVRHRCDNPPCCNDEHLVLGTPADNAADRESRGRGNQPKGERHNRAKLTEADVWEIRRRLAAGEVQRVIAAEFGVDPVSVSAIKTGKTWSYLK
jgi:hypothetical protein